MEVELLQGYTAKSKSSLVVSYNTTWHPFMYFDFFQCATVLQQLPQRSACFENK